MVLRFLFGAKQPAKARSAAAAAALTELENITDAPKDALTIMLPSKGRPAMLKGLLNYYNTAALPYKILLLLSGDKGLHKPHDYPNLDLTIVQFEDDIGFPAKLEEGLRHVKTPLVALCTDDDITLVDGLKKSAGFLSKNPDYSACQGYHGFFSAKTMTVNLTSIGYYVPSLDSEDPLRRVHDLLRRYQPVCWAVFRTSTFAKIVAAFRPEISLIFQEMLWSLTATVDGKIKRLHHLYCLRRTDRIYIEGHPFLAMLESPERYCREYASYRNMIVEQLAPHVARSKVDIARVLDLAYLTGFSIDIDTSAGQFFTNQVIEDPATTTHSEANNKALRPMPIHAESGWEKEVKKRGFTYRLFKAFLHPEPCDEIHFSPEQISALLTDLERYFIDYQSVN